MGITVMPEDGDELHLAAVMCVCVCIQQECGGMLIISR